MSFALDASASRPPRRTARGRLGPLLRREHPALQERERARRRVVALVLLIYLLAIFEGSLRKWVVPEFSQIVFFVRDPFLLLAYVLATRHGLWPRRDPWFMLSIGLAGFGLLLVALQALIGSHSEQRWILAANGYRGYFLYLPLAFLIGAQFRRDDLTRLYRWTLWIALPVSVLVVLQFFAPPSAPINIGISSDEALQFRGLGATADRVRPMGPFSSIAGQQQFVATAWAIALGLFLAGPARRRIALPLLALCTAAILVCIGVSGSRGTVVQCALTLAFGLAVGALGRGGALKGRALVWTASLLGTALVLYPIVLPEGFEALSQRWTSAAAFESRSFGDAAIGGRALFGLVDFIPLLSEVPLLGYGLGFGSNASRLLEATVDGVMPGKLVETDFSRHMVDLGPVFGPGYIAFRVAFTVWLFAIALRATRRVSDPMPLLLLSYVATTIFSSQITGQGAINVYAWLFAGVLIAACKATAPDRRGQRMP